VANIPWSSIVYNVVAGELIVDRIIARVEWHSIAIARTFAVVRIPFFERTARIQGSTGILTRDRMSRDRGC